MPNKLQWAAVLTVTKPVTHTLVAAVNKASTKSVKVPSDEETGRQSNTAPARIAARKPPAITCAELSLPERSFLLIIHFLTNLINLFSFINHCGIHVIACQPLTSF